MKPPSTLYPVARSVARAQSCLLQKGQRASQRNAVPFLSRLDVSSSSFATSLASNDNSNRKSNAGSDQKNNSNTTTNSNPSEVDKFSSFASNWWDARSNPLVGMNPIRIKFMREVVEHHFQSPATPNNSQNNDVPHFHLPLHDKRILDIGCGGGLLTESLSRLGASLVVGVDASPAVVEVAKMHSFHGNSRLLSPEQRSGNQPINPENGNIRYIGGSTVEELASNWLSENEKEQKITPPTTNQSTPQKHELFDIITALEVIEHVPNPTSLLQAAKSLLKPNGILFVSTINRTMKSYGLAIVAAEYISGKVPVGTHDWNSFWSPEEVERMVICDGGGSSSGGASTSRNEENASMKQIALSGMVIQPPFVNMKWSLDASDVDVNWIGAYQKKQVTP